MDFYNDDFYEADIENKLTVGKVIGKLFKWIAYLLIASVFAIIFARIYFAKTPRSFREFAFTENALAYYNENGSIEIGYQEPYTVYDDDGLYHVSDVSFSTDAGEIQLTVRYNSRSTVNTLMEKYGLTERPEGEVFVYLLSDDKGNEYTEYSFAAMSRPFGEFRRVIFDGVDFEGVENLYLTVYYGEDARDIAPMTASFTVYQLYMDLEKENPRYIEKKYPEPKDISFELNENPAYIRITEDEE